MTKRIAILTLFGSAMIAIALSQISVHSKLTVYLTLLAVGLFLIFLISIVWSRVILRLILLLGVLAASIWITLATNVSDPKSLRTSYLRNLRDFEGTAYVWGGEGKRGIDCSGLPRRALRDAMVSHGIIGGWLEQWWYDASAEALGKGYRAYTVPLNIKGTVNTINIAQLQPGDMAVTNSGIHLMVYLGENYWIQASPEAGKVIILPSFSKESNWFKEPVHIVRWRVFKQNGQS